MADVEDREGGGAVVKAAEAEEERLLMEEVAVLDFDMLCSTVAMQAQMGKWGKLNGNEEEEEFLYRNNEYGGVLRMWEGELLYDCFEDRGIAFQSTCCPCYRFGKNMKRAGLGSSFLQGSLYFILAAIALASMIAFVITRRHCFLYIAIAFTISVGTYVGFRRSQIKKKFNIKGSDSFLDDCVYHLICPCCTLCQESRTLEMNNVQDGIWHGRGDTICIGSYSQESKPFFELRPPSIVSIKSPECIREQKVEHDNGDL